MNSYKFKDDKELLEFIAVEVKKYTGAKERDKILFSYNRMTVDELAQEVFIKLLRTVSSKNKKYIRQAVIYVCIDFYRLKADIDPQGLEDSPENLEAPKDLMPERLMQLSRFSGRELEVILRMLDGQRNPEIREAMKIPKMTYYTLLKRLESTYAL